MSVFVCMNAALAKFNFKRNENNSLLLDEMIDKLPEIDLKMLSFHLKCQISQKKKKKKKHATYLTFLTLHVYRNKLFLFMIIFILKSNRRNHKKLYPNFEIVMNLSLLS